MSVIFAIGGILDIVAPALLGAIGSVVLGGTKSLLESWKSQRLSTESSFNAALESDDLATISRYLRDELGQVTTDVYLRDAKVRHRVDRCLARLGAFVAPPTEEAQLVELAAGGIATPTTKKVDARGKADFDVLPLSARRNDPPAISKALESLRAGEAWNALAGLRRDLEKLLRARRNPIASSSTRSNRLSLKYDVPADAAPAFYRFWRIASQAIHGEEISDEDAVQAIEDARLVYEILDQLPQQPNRDSN
ncbi:MAG: hypothetical protein KA085_03665 [Phenylobacterium sp.]|uniref:hypothetical protein n=1 Tax=Phenylobacterium sp. TaxID=1871053 RepID=UPI001B536C6F|nr:hypothetical protein [Phenylobacterium sp.]MBP7815196.1 hypothetical protein [Phenylobacterium sp.]MBP9754326.1 hypothetical protein [Phenylobacterium sp.]